MSVEKEWLETDGLGGFASGTASLVRTRRYHALLMRAVGSPSRRFVLVNGCDVVARTPEGDFALSSNRYQPGVVSPDGASRVCSFSALPWPTWRFALPGGRSIRQEILLARKPGIAILSWAVEGDAKGCSLEARPFLSGRDPHSLQGENGAFRFQPEARGKSLVWNPYDGVPPIAIRASGSYRHEPLWFRNFLLTEERARGLDHTEDLAAPGTFSFDLADGEAVLILASADSGAADFGFLDPDPRKLASAWKNAERRRRDAFPTPLHRAADDYLVRRGPGFTIIAGYPWFTDWGRDTFIAMRGLCMATGRLDLAAAILLEWSGAVSEGMLPNFFPEGAASPEYNSVDASLWFVIAVHDYFAAMKDAGRRIRASDRGRLVAAVGAILAGYSAGTRYGIRADSDGLLWAGQPGMQLTWMDAKVGDWVVTPRMGKPVEVQALWINALRAGSAFEPGWTALAARASESFDARFWNGDGGCLYDVVDVNFEAGALDASVRPNQIFAIGGLPWPVLHGGRAESVLRTVERSLLTPLGLRSLSPDHPDYRPRYEGGVRERDGAYHQGTVWPWLAGPFTEAWLRVHGRSEEALAEARMRFLAPLLDHLRDAGLGHVSEIADAEAPHTPRGCPFQAWSVGEALRMTTLLNLAPHE
jgi:predicted glycogen debranching enzyme